MFFSMFLRVFDGSVDGTGGLQALYSLPLIFSRGRIIGRR